MFLTSIPLLTDTYKVTHWEQLPTGATEVESYLSARGFDRSLGIPFREYVPFGFQYIAKQYLTKPVTTRDVYEAADYYAAHFGTDERFNIKGWLRIADRGGRLPVSIRATPEGMPLPIGTPCQVVRNTDPSFPWMPGWLETVLTAFQWYGATVATIAREERRLILKYLEETGDPSTIDFKSHDFGMRGVSSVEAGGLGGLAHLLSFFGTDTASALWLGREFYHETMAGFSIPASEHSTITSWGRENEVAAFRNMVERFGDGALYACVSDSYDIFNACSELWGEQLRAQVTAAPGTLVVRPDSGVPQEIVPKVIELLGEKFGMTTNAKGYRVLNPKVRVIQGDGIRYSSIDDILFVLKCRGLSADNIAFGQGGGKLQAVTRDSLKFAYKMSSIVVNGDRRDVFKDPVTDQGKSSLRGRVSVHRSIEDGSIYTYERRAGQPEILGHGPDLLREVYRNGSLLIDEPLSVIRERARL